MYNIRHFLPVQARLQIFHSFVQSHLNFCSLVWGFSTKANIKSLFASQKKGMRAAISGYVNYFYKDGNIPTHTKPSFCKYDVLTVHGIIATNTLIFMHKVDHFQNLLPSSVREIIAPNAPKRGSDHETCEDWLQNFGTFVYNKSVCYKGPLMYIDSLCAQIMTPTSILSVKAFKTNVKRTVLHLQSRGDCEEWQADNFFLYNFSGLRKSSRINTRLTN